MRIFILFSSLVLFTLLFQTQEADARCWCVTFIRSYNSRWIRKVDTGCNDNEMKAECDRAEWELTDWVGAVMAYARTLAQAHPDDLTEQDAKNQAALSYAVEAQRPVPDCATGLFTTTHLDDDSWKHTFGDDDDDGFNRGSCISLELLNECEKVRDGMEEYIASVISELQESDASQDFVNLMKIRIQNSITPTITCKTTDYHQEKVEDNSSDVNTISLSLLLGMVSFTALILT